MLRCLLAIALFALCAIPLGSTACAQETLPKLPGTAPATTAKPDTAVKPDTAADIDGLIKTLDDPAARDKLKQQLQLLLKAQRGQANAAQAPLLQSRPPSRVSARRCWPSSRIT